MSFSNLRSDTISSNNQEPVLNIVIIGCGMIAGGYDEEHNGDTVLSHAGAFTRHPGFHIVGCVEPNDTRRKTFMNYWKIEAGFKDIDSLLESDISFDIASICSPTPDHAVILEKLLKSSVKAVFCEKPLTSSLAHSKSMVEAYEAENRLLAVNYMRRWDVALIDLKKQIEAQEWGALQSAIGHYPKGLLSNGSHGIDLFQYLFGPLKPLSVLRCNHAESVSDPEIDVVLSTDYGALVYMISLDHKCYTHFELQLFMEKGQVTLESSGRTLRLRHIKQDEHYPAYRILTKGKWLETGFDQMIYSAIDGLYKAVAMSEPLVSTGHSALSAQRVCEDILSLRPLT